MRRRLYFIIPTVDDAEKIMKVLLLKRVCHQYVHFLAKEGTDMKSLPEATVFQKNDILHSVLLGAGAGVVFGIIAGIAFHFAMDWELGGGIVIAMIIGAILGAWSASMVGMMIPNIHLKPFYKAINKGRILMMVDIPKERVDEIEEAVRKRHPQVDYHGIEPTIPGFP